MQAVWPILRIFLICSALCSFSINHSTPRTGKGIFDFNQRCRSAYHSILQLKFDVGSALLREEKKENPHNLIVDLLENYIECITLFFNEDPGYYERFKVSWDRRKSRMEAGDSHSPYYLFSQGILHFQKGALDLKLGHYWSAGWDMHAAYKRFRENQALFHRFHPNAVYYASMQVVAGTIPEGWRWLSQLLGIRGDIRSGTRQLDLFLQQTDADAVLFREEAVFYYSYLKYYIENDRKGAFRLLEQQQPDLRSHHLFSFLAVNLHLNNQQSEEAVQIIKNRSMEAGYLQTPLWDFEMGNARLYHLESDAAQYLEQFLQKFKGSFYRKDALQKLSWHHYLNNDLSKAASYRARVISEGKAQTDPDKQAYREAKTGTWPHHILLKARLLFDGGYYQEALRLLAGKRTADFNLPKDKLEFCYRVARIYDATDRKKDAIVFYREAIRLGEFRKEYFAARSSLQLGLLYEAWNDKPQALQWFQRCLEMEDHEYENSLEQRAKAGIQRCTSQ